MTPDNETAPAGGRADDTTPDKRPPRSKRNGNGASPVHTLQAVIADELGGALHRSYDDFTMSPEGLTCKGVRLSDAFEIVGQTRTARSEGWGYLARWKDPDGREHRLSFGAADVHGSRTTDLIAAFADRGLRISPKRAAKELFLEYLAGLHVEERLTCVHRLGLTDDRRTFVMPDANFGAERDSIVLQSLRPHAFAQAGTLDGWRRDIAQRAVGQSRVMFALSVAFCGPLNALLHSEGGGFHFVGGSGVGKTTLLRAASSVWGLGEVGGFIRSWRSTDNGLEGIATVHNDTLLVLDEISEADARTVNASAYMLANGAGKQRANIKGEARAVETWRVPFLSSGEETLDQRVRDTTAGRRTAAKAGQMVRVVDIRADAGQGLGVFDHPDQWSTLPLKHAGAELAQWFKNAALRNYGQAGPAFVQHVMANPDAAERATRESMRVFLDRVGCDTGHQAMRVANRFAIVAAAGEMATHFGVTGWDPGAATEAALECFAAWCSAPLAPGASIESQSGVSAVRAFLSQFGDARFDMLDPHGELANPLRPVNSRAGFVRGEGEHREWLFLPDTFDEIAGGSAVDVARTLKDIGALKPGDGKNLRRREKSPLGAGKDRLRFYVVTTAVFDRETMEEKEAA